MSKLLDILSVEDTAFSNLKSKATKRSCSLGMEFLLKKGTPRSFSDDGTLNFSKNGELAIQVVDYAGSEDDIIPAKNEKVWFKKNLDHTLARSSDLDRLVIQLHCKSMPIACTVQFMMNSYASVNEFSARYAKLPEGVISKTDLEEILSNTDENIINTLESTINELYEQEYKGYNELVNSGVVKELSRGVLPTSQHTEFFTKLSLLNFINFIQIFEDDALMASAIEQMKIIFQLGYPCIYKLFKDGNLNESEKKIENFVGNNKNENNTTCRHNAEKIEESFGKKKIICHENNQPLDGEKCWIKVTDYLGTVKTPYHAVGMSFGVEENPSSMDTIESLIQLLISLGHGSPFELPTLLFESQVPYFVFRHLIRHRTMGIYNWQFIDETFAPKVRAEKGAELSKDAQANMDANIKKISAETQEKYLKLKSLGLPEEACSLVYPVVKYVKFSGKVDIHNLVHFLNLRTNPAAQYETRLFANTIKDIFADWVPIIYKAFVDNKRIVA
ncbi:MAG: FAD-dependent thymidylate synthase [Holosporales bacterium]|jgi:thymidylate synthase (FAD)|nr:FAD-dependent thymidylate synthase [Holosporales bacterium]